MSETSDESPGPGTGPGTHSHAVAKLVGLDRMTGFLLLATLFVALIMTTGMLLVARNDARRAAELAELTREQAVRTAEVAASVQEQADVNGELTVDGVECILAQLGEHRINSSSFNQSAADSAGIPYEPDVDVAVPEDDELIAIQDACRRFLPTTAGGGG